MRGWYYFLALVAGALIHLSLAPYNLWLVGFTGLLVFAGLLALSESRKAVFTLTYSFATGLFGAGVNWVYVSIHTYGEVPAPLAVIFTGGFVLFLALIFALPWLLIPSFAKTRAQRLLVFPFFWFLTEWLRGWLLTGFPWLYLGYGQVDGLLSGWLPIIGVLGAGALIASCASLLVWTADRRSSGVTLLSTVFIGLILLLERGFSGLEWTKDSNIDIPVTLVQPDIPLRDKWNPAKTTDILDVLETSSSDAWQPGLLIWPEAAIPYTGSSADPYVEFIDQLSTASNTAMVTGLLTYDDEQGRYLNSIVGLGKVDSIYHKQRLVPFGEYVPLESWLRGTMQFFNLPMSIISRGPADQEPLSFEYQDQTYNLAPAICYEIAYASLVADLAKKADLLVTLSNDAWFGASIGPWQHMQIAQARALENQKPLIRVTNNGISGLVDYRGQLYASLPQFTQTKLKGLVEPRTGMSAYNRLGNIPLIVISLLVLVYSAINSRRTPKQIII